jgi:hypothetical protein
VEKTAARSATALAANSQRHRELSPNNNCQKIKGVENPHAEERSGAPPNFNFDDNYKEKSEAGKFPKWEFPVLNAPSGTLGAVVPRKTFWRSRSMWRLRNLQRRSERAYDVRSLLLLNFPHTVFLRVDFASS